MLLHNAAGRFCLRQNYQAPVMFKKTEFSKCDWAQVVERVSTQFKMEEKTNNTE